LFSPDGFAILTDSTPIETILLQLWPSQRSTVIALVKKLEEQKLEKVSPHLEVECRYSIVDGGCLQFDTYGSNTRKVQGVKIQTIRFSREAVAQLKDLLEKHF
jgi:hypothetical protein